MKKKILYLILVISCQLMAQTPQADELVNIHAMTATEMSSISNPEVGSLVYNTTDKIIYVRTDTEWVNLEKPSTLVDNGDGTITYTNETDASVNIDVSGTSNTYTGHFIITETGNQNITGIPFQPSQVTFIAHANIETLDIDADNGVGNNNNGIPNAFGTMNGYARTNGSTIIQQVIYVGGNGNSINDISRYSSSSRCIGLRYGNQNGDNLGKTTASLTSFNADGFSINVVDKIDNVVVLYTAYK